MTTTTTNEPGGFAMEFDPSITTIRTYESYSIKWDRGSEWTNYTLEQAQATIANAAKHGSVGTIVRKTWDVEVKPQFRSIYLPGIAERAA